MYHNNYIFIKTIRETKTPRNAEDSFYYFIKNSKIRFASYYSNKYFLFNCIFNKDDNLSPYFYLFANGEMVNVKIITIKISFTCENKKTPLSFRGRPHTRYDNADYPTPGIRMNYISPYDFFKENCRQCEIAEAGIMHLNRNTPIMLFSKLYDNKSANYKMLYKTLCKNVNKKTRRYLTDLFTPFNNINNSGLHSKYYFALTVSEFISSEYINCYDVITPIIDEIHSISCKQDYVIIKQKQYNEDNENVSNDLPTEIYNTLELSNFSERLKIIYNIARYEIISIAVNTGYSHGDYHIENLFLYEDLRSIIVTNFSNLKHIPQYENIQNNWHYLMDKGFERGKETFRIMKEILEDIYNTHFQDADDNSRHYKWLKHIDESDIDTIIELHKFRNLVNLHSTPSIFTMYLNTRRAEYVYNSSLEIDINIGNRFINCISSLFC